MPLHDTGREDPHAALYAAAPRVAKQFLNVNDNIPLKGKTAEEYLAYGLDIPDKYRVSVILNQLFLKHAILHSKDIAACLPLIPTNQVFVHKETHGRGKDKVIYEAALYFKDGAAHFLDLGREEDRTAFLQLLANYGVDWAARYEEMRDWNKKSGENQDMGAYDVIVGPNLFLEIQDAHETLLYEYDEILARIDQAKHPFSPAELKLAGQYDQVRGKNMLREDTLRTQGLIANQGEPLRQAKTRSEAASIELYQALQEYDKWLDELSARYPSLSFRQLTGDENLSTHVNAIFGSTRRLQNLYKSVEKFEGVRESEVVPVYQGIWWCEDGLRYVVGSASSMNSTQANAHRVRRIQVYQGKDGFVIRPLLESMGVTFIRLNQYTVFPYYFHLIDLYIENVLEYQVA